MNFDLNNCSGVNANILKLVESEEDRFSQIVISELSEIEQTSLLKVALELLAYKNQPGTHLTSPADTRAYLQIYLGEHRIEVFGCLFLDNKHRVIATEELFHGTIDGASVYPRGVVERTLLLNAAAVIFFHNHPSGTMEPSHSDIAITKRLINALATIDVRVLDHYIVSATGSMSFSERGLI